MNITKPETYYLKWQDPQKKNELRSAGVAFYNQKYNEYLMKVDEDEGKQYFLRPVGHSDGVTHYRFEMVLKKKDGSFKRRQCIGSGESSDLTGGDVHIRYGSKYATLVLLMK